MVGSLTANGDSGRSGATSMSVSWTTVAADMSVPSSIATASSSAASTSASVSGRGALLSQGATPCTVSSGASHGVGPRTMVSGSASACDARSRAAASATASHGVIARRRSVAGSGGSGSASHGESQGGVVRGARRSTEQRGADDWTRSGGALSPLTPVRPVASSPTTTVGSSTSSSKSEATVTDGGGAVVSRLRGLDSTGGSMVAGVAARRTMLLVVRRVPSPVGGRERRTAVPSATGAGGSGAPAAGWPSAALAATSIPS